MKFTGQLFECYISIYMFYKLLNWVLHSRGSFELVIEDLILFQVFYACMRV